MMRRFVGWLCCLLSAVVVLTAIPAEASAAPAGTTWKQVTAGYAHTCALSTDGGAWCWGSDRYGQLGNGVTNGAASVVPRQVRGLGAGVVALSAGAFHTCALTSAGAVWCWGYGFDGELGNGKTDFYSVPVRVIGLGTDVATIAAGGFHTCALSKAGVAWCWGDNMHGQLGDGNLKYPYRSLVPVQVTGLDAGVTAITVAGGHSCAVTTDGAAWCWGDNSYGDLGNGNLTASAVPVRVTGLDTGVAAISAGGKHTCAVTTAGAAWCWGNNANGRLGNGSTVRYSTVPVPVKGLGAGVGAIAAGGFHTCAVTTGKVAWCWGDNTYGGLGDGSTTFSAAPVRITGLGAGVGAIATGGYHTCVVTTAGVAWCWGWGRYGQLGNGSTSENSAVPVRVKPAATS